MSYIPEITKAVQEVNVEVVKKLIEDGCDVNESTNEYLPPLAYADIHTYRLLIEAGANILFIQQDKSVLNLIIHNKSLSEDVFAYEFV